jgi:HAMP domain-containing protein
MKKSSPIDSTAITTFQLAHLDADELGLLAQQLEVQSQQINRAMRLVAQAMSCRRTQS